MEIEISKSSYCKGLQCPKILWMDMHKPEEAETDNNEAVLETGKRVGEVARQYFGKCEVVGYNPDKSIMIGETQRLMESGAKVIAEASFAWDHLFCSVDLLRKVDGGYDIIEVKSSTEVKGIYIDDVSFQYCVLKYSGVDVKHAYIMHIDSSYERKGELELDKLFCIEDFTECAIRKEEACEIEREMTRMINYVKSDEEPEKDIDMCCEEPYGCAYYGYCRKHLPEESVFDIRGLSRKKKYEYYYDGIVSFEEVIREHPKISAKQLKQVETAYYDKPDYIDTDGIAGFLDTLRYPIYHLDFETFQQAVPEFDGVHPYDQIPFQYSLHIEYENGRLEHREFLAEEGTDPRRPLAERLCEDIPADVCVLAYNMSFEKRVINELARTFPDISEHLMSIRGNICDLMIPFQKQQYYTKAMQGSYSIKYVLPALYPDDPELDYHNLDEVHNGSEASAAFLTMTNHSPEETASLRANLLKYCGLDTYAMVKVLRKLREVCGK